MSVNEGVTKEVYLVGNLFDHLMRTFNKLEE